jgi:hypothetical protein
MQKRKMQKRFRFIGLGLGVLLLMAAPAFSGQRMIQALKSGILVLIVPPTLGSIGMIFIVYKKRNQVRQTDAEKQDESGGDW